MAKTSTIKERILTFLEKKGIKKVDFFESTGINASNFKGVNLKSAPGGDILVKILSTHPELSADWLMTGNGEMLKEMTSMQNISTGVGRELHGNNTDDATRLDFLKSTRPRIPLNATAGYLSVIAEAAKESDCERIPIITCLPEYDFTIRVSGESMIPEYMSGDEIACRMLLDWSEIQWGQAHILDTSEGVILKNIYNGGDEVMCRSINPGFKDYLLPKSDILHIARVVGLIRPK